MHTRWGRTISMGDYSPGQASQCRQLQTYFLAMFPTQAAQKAIA